jgi:hypothetical protein
MNVDIKARKKLIKSCFNSTLMDFLSFYNLLSSDINLHKFQFPIKLIIIEFNGNVFMFLL